MKFIGKWSYSCANHLATAMNESHERRAVYYYGFYIVIGAAVKLVILVSLALLLRVLLPTLALFFVFGSLRMFAGGMHMDTYNKCLIVSFTIFLSGAAFSEYTDIFWNNEGLFVLAAVALFTGIYILLKYAPKDTPNKRITNPTQINRLKKLSVLYLFILISVIVVLIKLGLEKYAIAACLGILFELFTITPRGHKFFYRISGAMK